MNSPQFHHTHRILSLQQLCLVVLFIISVFLMSEPRLREVV